jgi:hypothetical protein
MQRSFTAALAILLVVLACSGVIGSARADTNTVKLEAFFANWSYAPGSLASLAVNSSSSSLTIELFRCGPELGPTRGDSTIRGVPVEAKSVIHWARQDWSSVSIRLHHWPSGLYFARVRDRGGHVFFAPFVLRAAPNMKARVAVVIPTNTWQAYNFRDDDADGVPNSWYADEAVSTVDVSRPFLHRGVPPHFRSYDLSFIRWLGLTARTPDFLTDDDLERLSSKALLAHYDLIVFPGHHEYVTEHVYNVVEAYRDRGGNLMFLSANNFFRRVSRSGDLITRGDAFRELGRPEARWIGVQYVDWNQDLFANRPYLVVGRHAAPWLFEKTRLGNGSRFGVFGIEIDARTSDSPPGTRVLAVLRDIFGPGKSGEMTYHQTSAGAKVFAAGAFTLAGSALAPPVPGLLENLWEELSRP